jgi:hypothetical protein
MIIFDAERVCHHGYSLTQVLRARQLGSLPGGAWRSEEHGGLKAWTKDHHYGNEALNQSSSFIDVSAIPRPFCVQQSSAGRCVHWEFIDGTVIWKRVDRIGMASLQEYLKRYTDNGVEQGQDDKKKKKRKKVKEGSVPVKKLVPGIIIHDEDAQWQKKIEKPKEEEEGN